jgi:RNA polymerase sigma factor (sigma-70 family)
MTFEQSALTRPREGGVTADEPDWDAVYADQLPRIYAYFRFRLGTAAEIEDLVSRTFEKAWRSRHRYRRDLGGFGTWLLKIAQNVGIDYLRSRRTHLPIDLAIGLASERTPEMDVARCSDLARLTQLIAGLPERERDLVALKYGADINNISIASLTGLSVANVATILHRAVQALRSKW